MDITLTDDVLDRWRKEGDEPADALARALLTAYGSGGLDETEVVALAMRAVAEGTASRNDSVREWLSEGPVLPEWTDPGLVAVGQRFFRAWPMPIATTLFCAVLPTAYAAPHGAAVLMATSHLRERGQVARRLAATGQMLFDVMDFHGTGRSAGVTGSGRTGRFGASRSRRRNGLRVGGLEPGGQGYVTTLGVRLLHAVVREALLASSAHPWPADERGRPVNQEDLLGLLCGFMVGVLDGLDDLGVRVTDAEARGYVHTWSVVGSLLGIHESFLPLDPDQARDVGQAIAARQLEREPDGRPSSNPDGAFLVGELLREMQLAMPAGCQGLPGALMHRLVPTVAERLEVPPPTPRWRWMVDGACGLTRSLQQVPGLTGLVTGPVALVGRSMLRMYVDREQQPGGPPYRLDTAALRQATGGGGARRTQARNARRAQRGDDVGIGPHVRPSPRAALAALSHPVDLPIDVEDVRLIASEGFPLWEPVEVMVHRNRRITLAYADLSQRLAELLAGTGGVLDANWCTFATWSSRTIGSFIEDIPRLGPDSVEPASVMPDYQGPLAPQIARLTVQLMTRSDGASFRTLAAGNRAVFLEIGLSISMFLEHFPDPSAAAGHDAEDRWTAYWAAVEAQLAEMALFDPSWLLTPCPVPDDLRLGLRQFFQALQVDDQELRSQHVLAGNLLLGAYEQRRVDGYVWAALSLFTDRAMRRLIRDRTGVVGGVRRWPNGVYARVMTRRMALELPDGELIRIAEPVPPPPDPRDQWHALATDADVTLPVLQALVTRYQLATGRRPNQGARNWTSFDQRMRTIGNLFRFRQRQRNLFTDPFPPDQTDRLLAGRDDTTPRDGPHVSTLVTSAPAPI